MLPLRVGLALTAIYINKTSYIFLEANDTGPKGQKSTSENGQHQSLRAGEQVSNRYLNKAMLVDDLFCWEWCPVPRQHELCSCAQPRYTRYLVL
jgi:hypothetical protein